MRHYRLLLAATLAIAGLSAGCESWNNDKTPDLDNGTSSQDTSSTDQSNPDRNNTGTSTTTDNSQTTGSPNDGSSGTSGSR